MQQPSGIQRSSEPVAPRRLPKNSLRESLENVGALSKTLFFLPSSFLLPPPVVRGLLARGHVYSFGSFLRPALVCSQNVSPPPLPTPPEQVPVRLWGFLGTSVVPPPPRKALGFPPRWLRLSGGWLWACQPLQSWTRRRPPWSRKSGTSTWGQQQSGSSQVAECASGAFLNSWVGGGEGSISKMTLIRRTEEEAQKSSECQARPRTLHSSWGASMLQSFC